MSPQRRSRQARRRLLASLVASRLLGAAQEEGRGPIDRSGIGVTRFCAFVSIILEPHSRRRYRQEFKVDSGHQTIGEIASAQPELRTKRQAAQPKHCSSCGQRERQNCGKLNSEAGGCYFYSFSGLKRYALAVTKDAAIRSLRQYIDVAVALGTHSRNG